MKALILAAGMGTRLEHLTKNTPKALVKTGGITLLEHTIRKLKQAGVTEIMINVHHFYEQIIDFVEKNDFGLNICFSIEKDALLDTGGGLKKAAWFFDDDKPFLIHNVDVISDIDLLEMYHFHCEEGVLATLAVRNRETQRYFLFDKNNFLCGRENLKTDECVLLPDSPPRTELKQLAFSGIHIVSPQIFAYMPKKDIFSITELYLHIPYRKVIAYQHDKGNWKDMGKISCYVL